MKNRRFTTRKGTFIILVMFLVMLAIAIISINSGKMNLTPGEVLNVLFGNGTDKQNLIVFEFRRPRIILAMLVGVSMGASGCIMQSLLQNDMASPGTLGISSGSGMFVLIFVVIFPHRGFLRRLPCLF